MKYFKSQLGQHKYVTPQGYVCFLGIVIARTGTQEYYSSELVDDNGNALFDGPERVIKISRTEKELFSKETIASFEGQAFTINHPKDFLTIHNWSMLAKGFVTNVRRGSGSDSDKLIADITVTDMIALTLINNGVRELSCGYDSEYRITGNDTGEQYDIRGNHVALVSEGRCGPSCKIVDKKTVNNTVENKKEKTSMAKITVRDKAKEFLSSLGLKGKTLDEALEKIPEKTDSGEKTEKNETTDVDKRKLIDEVGGFLKEKGLSDEDIRFVMEKMEKESYEPSEGSKNDDSKTQDSEVARIKELFTELAEALAPFWDEEAAEGAHNEGAETGDSEGSEDEDKTVIVEERGGEGGKTGDKKARKANVLSRFRDKARTIDQDTVARASVLMPAFTKDQIMSYGSRCGLERTALKMRYADHALIIDRIMRGKTIDTCGCETLDAAFYAVSEAEMARNNAAQGLNPMSTRDSYKKTMDSISEFQKNAEKLWKK